MYNIVSNDAYTNASVISLMSLYLILNPEFIFNPELYWVLESHSYIFYQGNNIILLCFSKSLWEQKKNYTGEQQNKSFAKIQIQYLRKKWKEYGKVNTFKNLKC